MAQSRQEFRHVIRQKRNLLLPNEQKKAELALCEQFFSLPEVLDAKHIAIYLSNDGEINTTAIISELWAREINVYLPVLHPFSSGHLLFLHYLPNTPMQENTYGIPEPVLDKRLITPLTKLDMVCTPLVAFDRMGNRLGMGGGYYDRALAPWFEKKANPMPIGLAHSCQYVDKLPTEKWDVPLPKIITPDRIWSW